MLASDLGGWLHDLNPVVMPIAGPLAVRWYGLSYIAGFIVGYLVLRRLAKRGLIAIPADRISDAMMLLIVGVVIGGRLGYLVMYRPSYFWTFGEGFPWWAAIDLTKGGMASHGGMIGVVIAGIMIARGFRDFETGERVGACPKLHVADAIALAAPFGLMFGRIANFVNGELLGKIVTQPGERAPWWSVRYPQELLSDHAKAVEYTDEQRMDLARLAYDFAPEAMFNAAKPPTEDALFGNVIGYLHRGNAEVAERIEPLISARHPSQLYQAIAEGVIVAVAVWLVARKPRLPGVVTAWFLIVYGLGRVVTEVWRLPDDHFKGAGGFFDLKSAQPFGLSRGQWLSVLMVMIGIGLLVWRSKKREANRYLGWAAPRGG